MKRWLVIAALITALVIPAVAQNPNAETHRKGEELFREFLENEARALSLEDTKNLSIRELVDVIMKVQITQLLGLTKDEAKDLFSRMGGHLDRIHNLKWERGAIHYYLREDLKIGADDEDVTRKLNSAMDVEVKIAELIRAMIGETDPVLDADQQAKLFFFTYDFENDIKRMIQQAEDLAIQRFGPTSDKYRPGAENSNAERNGERNQTPQR